MGMGTFQGNVFTFKLQKFIFDIHFYLRRTSQSQEFWKKQDNHIFRPQGFSIKLLREHDKITFFIFMLRAESKSKAKHFIMSTV